MSTEFQKGDFVKRTTVTSWSEEFGVVGEEYEVLKVNNSGSISVIKNKFASRAAFELVFRPKFKAGDVVRKVSGKPFGNGKVVNVIQKYAKIHSGYVPWVENGWINEDKLMLVEEKETRVMGNNNPFVVEEVQTTVTKKINTLVNGCGPGASYVSIRKDGDGINLVIGAKYEDELCGYFSKSTLTELIQQLTEVRDLM